MPITRDNLLRQLTVSAMQSMTSAEWINFGAYKMHNARALMDIKVDWSLLRAAASCWDPELHLFKFGSAQLCPTHEDICGVMGISSLGSMVQSLIQPGFVNQLKAILKLSRKQANEMVHNRRLSLEKILEPYYFPTCFEERPWRDIRDYLLCMGIISEYLLVSEGDGHTVPDYFIGIVGQLKKGANLISTILAETFRGSPYLLYVWLCDRLSLVSVPTIIPYEPHHFARRTLMTSHKDGSSWSTWLHTRTIDDIIWDCPWWEADDQTLFSKDYDYVRLMGLMESSFYILTMIPMKLDYSSNTSPPPSQMQILVPERMTLKMIPHITAAWDGREFVHPESPKSKKLRVVYDEAWLDEIYGCNK